MPVETPPICACCREPISSLWALTAGAKVFVLCGNGSCEGWARSQGLTITMLGRQGARPVARAPRRAAKPRCDHCKGSLPARRHQFHEAGRRYCTLTCMESARAARDGQPGVS